MKKVIDHYSKKAKKENYAARSVYKLMEIDKKYHLIKRGLTILDIGCSPGSWSQYILKKLGNGKLCGVDISNKISIKDNRFVFINEDIFNLDINIIENECGKFDLIVSDAAPNTSGDKFTDSQKSLHLLEQVFKISEYLLKPGGNVVAKVFQGEDLENFLRTYVKTNYCKLFRFKPKSSRKESKEIYIIALGKGNK